MESRPIEVIPEQGCDDPRCDCCHPDNYCHWCIGSDAWEATLGSTFSCRICHSVYRVDPIETMWHYQQNPELYQNVHMPRIVYTCIENRMYMGPKDNEKNTPESDVDAAAGGVLLDGRSEV